MAKKKNIAKVNIKSAKRALEKYKRLSGTVDNITDSLRTYSSGLNSVMSLLVVYINGKLQKNGLDLVQEGIKRSKRINIGDFIKVKEILKLEKKGDKPCQTKT